MAARRKRGGPLRRLLRALAIACLVIVAAVVVSTVAYRWIDPPTSAFMLRDRMRHLGADDYRFRYEWRDFDAISRNAALAVIAAEDQRFIEHDGFDFKQIDKALKDRERGRRVRGASTISQQVAKNLFLWPGQSWIRKGMEAGLTVLIELAWGKQRILEVYLNVAEFGRGTWGVEAASQRYFGKPAARLSRSEAALLAAVLPNPIRFKVDAPSAYVRKRQAWIERQMRALGGTALLARLE